MLRAVYRLRWAVYRLCWAVYRLRWATVCTLAVHVPNQWPVSAHTRQRHSVRINCRSLNRRCCAHLPRTHRCAQFLECVIVTRAHVPRQHLLKCVIVTRAHVPRQPPRSARRDGTPHYTMAAALRAVRVVMQGGRTRPWLCSSTKATSTALQSQRKPVEARPAPRGPHRYLRAHPCALQRWYPRTVLIACDIPSG